MNRKKMAGNLIGAQIMDDPTATQAKVDYWFRTLAEHRMPLARVFIPRGEDKLRRMDWFFRAAEKYSVSITATLGGQPSNDNAAWIRKVVQRYKGSPALDSWILMNEPGQGPEANKLAVARFKEWLKAKYVTADDLNKEWGSNYTGLAKVEIGGQGKGQFSSPVPFLDWYTFWRSHLTWHLGWIADQIRKVDKVHPTHVNPHALVGNLAAMSFDLPAWRTFLTSLGASCHPSWHFTLLRRDEYALGVAYICDLIHGASEPNPFWITELQGGNNTHSGYRPLCPSKDDIAQWLWTGFGSGSERMVFWLLNNRSRGVESGEWSLLDFQGQTTERLEAAGQVAKCIQTHADFFENARPIETPITILLSLESMTLQEHFSQTRQIPSIERGNHVKLEARDRNAHLFAALAFYKTLQELGIPARIKHMHDFDWRAASAARQLAILPNAVALSDAQARDIEAFVRNGNTALITGLTGAWAPDNRFWPLTSKYPLEDLLGATLKEIRTLDDNCHVSLQKPKVELPSHVWVGEIRNRSAEVIGKQNGWITAVRKKAGRGEAIWIPSLVDMGAWLDDNKPLARFLTDVTAPFTKELRFRFAKHQPGCLLRVLRDGKSYVTVITNGTTEKKRLRLRHQVKLTPKMLWGAKGISISRKGDLVLGPRETVVALWS